MPDPSSLSTGFAELDAGATVRVRVWGLPTGFFLWAPALAVTGQLALAALHVLAAAFYVGMRRQHRVKSMLSGDKLLSRSAADSRDTGGSRLLAPVILGACAGFAF